MSAAFKKRIAETLVKTLPRKHVYEITAVLARALLRSKAKRLRADTARLFPDKPAPWIKETANRQIAHRAWVAVDKLTVTKMSDEELTACYEPSKLAEAVRILDEARAGGRGTIFYSLHYGRPVLGSFLTQHGGYELTGVYSSASTTGLQDMMVSGAASVGAKFIEAGDLAGGVYALRTLKANRFLYIMVDGRATHRPTMVDFLGHKMPVSLGFAQLARRTGATLIAGTTFTVGGPFELESHLERVELPPEELAPEELGALLLKPFEKIVMRDVGQWYGINRLFRAPRRRDDD